MSSFKDLKELAGHLESVAKEVALLPVILKSTAKVLRSATESEPTPLTNSQLFVPGSLKLSRDPVEDKKLRTQQTKAQLEGFNKVNMNMRTLTSLNEQFKRNTYLALTEMGMEKAIADSHPGRVGEDFRFRLGIEVSTGSLTNIWKEFSSKE